MALSARVQLDRLVFPISGPEAEPFLNNLLTADVTALARARVIYAGLLTPQGKVAFDFMLWRDGESFLVDVAAARAADLIQRLGAYRLRAKLEIGAPLATLGVFAANEGDAEDPRLPALGARTIAPAGAPPSDEPAAYRTHRIELGVPDLLRDQEDAEAFALEALFEEFHGVDFHKGCFIGQENVSRMKRRATTRRKFCPITFEGAPPAHGAPIDAGPASIGTVRSGIEDRALAFLRLDRAGEAAARGAPLIAEGKVVRLAPPPWLLMPA